MQFRQLDFHLQKCEQHLDSTKTRNTEIESYFVQYLLTRICAEYEARIAILVGFNDPIPVSAQRHIMQHVLHQDARACEGQITAANLRVGDDVLPELFPFS